jgi:hypothetical protein
MIDRIPAWQRIALCVIGAWTAFGGISTLMDPDAYSATFLNGAHVDSTVLAIAYAQLIAWGAGYALAAFSRTARSPILIAGALGKTMYFAITVVAFTRGAGSAALLATGIGDALIASFFAFLLFRSVTFARGDQPSRS